MGDVLIWYVWTQAFALVGWLIASRWLRRLPDAGYGIAKALGLVLVAFVYWLGVTAGVARNNAGGVLLSLAIVAGGGVLLWLAERRTDSTLGARAALPARNYIISIEALFAFAFLVVAFYRAYAPNIESAGGEKFMESMFINAIIRSPIFPPNDAWLSGFAISYYYFGYVVLAMMTLITGVAPAVAFNLGGAMMFALTVAGAFSVGYNLWAARTKNREPSEESDTAATTEIAAQAATKPRAKFRSALLAGLLTATMLAMMGNLGGALEAARCARALPQEFWQWLDVRHIATEPIECNGLAPTRFYWWWNWSRVVHDYTPGGGDQEVITEMPAFSFVLGDNHPHVMALPFVLIAVTIALHFYLGNWSLGAWSLAGRGSGGDELATRAGSKGRALARSLRPLFVSYELLLTAIIIGGLSFMNTWDFPVYGALIVGSLLLSRLLKRQPIWPAVAFSAIVFALGYVLYLPFYATFASQAKGIGVNLFNGTRFAQFFVMFAAFIFAAPGFIWLSAKELRVTTRQTARQTARLATALALALLGASLVFGLLNPQARAYAAELNSTGQVLGVTRDAVQQSLNNRVPTLFTPLFLFAIAAACGAIILAAIGRQRQALGASAEDSPSNSASQISNSLSPFVLLLFLGGALLTAAVEFVFIQDNFGTRMNTVFKFYYMAWVVWSVAGAFALMTFIVTKGVVAKVSAVLVGATIVAGLLYPVFAASSRANQFTGAPTLDGSAYLKKFQPSDAAAIDWLNKNVKGDAVVLEAPGDKFASYKYEGRISAFTGLQALLGWGGHQNQWRGNYTEPGKREPDIDDLFRTTDATLARSLLSKYGVDFVVVGQTERQRYPAAGLAKFDALGSVAFRSGETVVYRVR